MKKFSNELLSAEILTPQSSRAGRVRDVVFYTGAKVERFSFFDGRYWLQLSTDEGAADLSRFNDGAPVTNGHNRKVMSDQIGVIEKAWWEDGKSFATMRLSDRDEVTPIWQDIESKIIRNVSMDISILDAEEKKTKNGELEIFATSWEPQALAIVPAGADPGAHFLSQAYDPETDIVTVGGVKCSRELFREFIRAGGPSSSLFRLERCDDGTVALKKAEDAQSGKSESDHRLAIEEARLRLF